MSRPEDILPPDLYYNDSTSQKYTTSSRIQEVQTQMTQRALQLLSLSVPSLVLDVGCGSGISGSLLSSDTATAAGPHTWVGLDISSSMLAIALERDVEGDLLLADAGQGVPFRAGTFDAAISISAIQWLCNAENPTETAAGRLARFFGGLYASLRRGGKAVCQFYPRDAAQRDLICKEAIRAGFRAGILEDEPGTKKVKLYLVLRVSGGNTREDSKDEDTSELVKAIDDVYIVDERRNEKERERGKARTIRGSRHWILQKKQQMERKGRVVKASSKYTGRKRRVTF